jgi:spermidine/putrescine transport system ATP-binding protein
MAEVDSGDLLCEGLHKEFDTFVAVHNLDLTVPRGSFFALLGPSGCGKTTTLRMVAGLEEPTAGRIALGDQDITRVKAYRRNVNTVFQSYALFPHLRVIDNVAFGLRRRRDKDAVAKAQDALEMVQLGHLAQKRPNQLSGGMQQRVALARALVNRPEVLLLDEPLGALDLKLRRQMQLELKRIQSEVGLTFVHVTHDQEEAMTMADTVAVMNAGKLEQIGDPATLYDHPASTFVANFLGQSNLLTATITSGPDADGLCRADTHGTEVQVSADQLPPGVRQVYLGVRPEKLRIGTGNGTNQLRGQVTDASFTGVATQYQVALPWGFEVTVVQPNDGSARPQVGHVVDLCWNPGQEFLLDAAQDEAAGMMREVG